MRSTTLNGRTVAYRSDTQDFQTDGLKYPDIPNCHIVGILGHGGMGIVYQAVQAELHREVAVKTILAGIASSPMVVARFFAEAEAMAAVRHPNVAQVFEFGKAQGTPYLIVELLPGGTLADRLRDRKSLPVEEAVRLIEKLARAVGATHAQQIVHRDLKPSNVMFDAAGEPKVTDFGLAKRADSNLTLTDLQMGTPHYMAPEQAEGQAKFVGPPADVWALGVILFECLTGTRPFEGKTTPSIVHEVVHAEAPLLRRMSAALPRDLETICQKCLTKDVAGRYPTGTELADELLRWLDGKPILARRTPPAERLALWAHRKPMHALAWVLVPLTVVLGTFGLILFLMWRSAERAYAGEQQAKATVTRAKEQLALFSRIREETLQKKPGWTWQARADLAEFGKLQPDADRIADLRTDAAAAQTCLDFRETTPLTTGFPIGSLAVSPDGRWVAVGEFKPGLFVLPMGVHLFDAKAGKKERTVTFTPGVIVNLKKGITQDILLHLAFSRDGNHLFAGLKSGRLVYWDVRNETANPAKVWEAGREITSLAPSPDGRFLYTFTKYKGGVQKWEPQANGKPLLHPVEVPDGALALHPTDGDLFAGLGSDLFALDAGTLATKPPSGNFAGHGIHQVCFHPEGKWLAVGAGRTLRIVDAATRLPTMAFVDPVLKTTAHAGSVEHVAVHPSGAVLVSLSDDADDHTLKVWSVTSGKLIGATAIPGEGLMSLAISADGRTIYVGSSDRTHRFDLRGLEVLKREVPAAGFVETAALTPAGTGVAILTRRPELTTAAVTKPFLLSLVRDGRTTEYAFSVPRQGDGRFGLATADDRVAVTTDCADAIVWSSRKPTRHQTLPIPSASLPRFQPSADRLWVVQDGHEHRPWNLATEKAEAGWSNAVDKVLKGAAGIQAAAVGSTRVVAGTRDGSVVLVDPATGKIQSRATTADGPVTSLALSRDESLAVAGLYAGKLRTLNLTAGTEDVVTAPHRDTITAVALGEAVGSRYLATGSSDRSIRLFVRDGSAWRPLFALNDLGSGVNALEFTPDGGRLLFACASSLGYRVLDLDALHTELAKDGFGWK
ncbi:WD40 repeat domain-containing serine/threonine protein kinase [Limnoglobus roseus]|uniref:WD40 repeat domain-containing serine/threonine protein kinase n=1 Tax=Limnoglobus roseus TaxID=2598579 RepID=UPI00143D1F0A|nr:WD40 repeat domain-containing serine/threonine-protein kinase [Limnoglobus roseus]